MAKTNVSTGSQLKTHEGGPAKQINAEQMLRRSIMACLLWENTFYEEGVEIAERIASLVPQVDAIAVSNIAIEARDKMKLRHVPLWVVRQMAKLPSHKHLVATTLERVIQRSDELTEFLSLYWKDKKEPLSAQVKKGLARAFRNFDEYQLTKYDRDEPIRLRDVMFLVHTDPLSPRSSGHIVPPINKAKYKRGAVIRHDSGPGGLWRRLIDGTLEPPNTWEVRLSKCKTEEEKREVWLDLLYKGKLGALALLRNLRNMLKVGVPVPAVVNGLDEMKVEKVLPYRFIAAAKYATQLEPDIEKAMFKCTANMEKLPGETILLVDVSGSMEQPLSAKTEMRRAEAANALAILVREICERVRVFTFSDNLTEVPPRRGFALRDAIDNSQPHSGTHLGQAVSDVNTFRHDRIIVITDEQAHDTVPGPKGKGYMVNVACYQNGVGYGPWTHVDGFSESTINYIHEIEKSRT